MLPLPVTVADRRERAERVREIGRKVAAGQYLIPVERVADAVLTFHRREGRS